MAVDLTNIRIRSALPVPALIGGVQRSELGGASQYVGGLGSRWSFVFETPPMLIEPDGRQLLADLTKGLREGVRVRVEQPDFDGGSPGSPKVRTATASGLTIPIKTVTPNAVIRKGAWFNYYDASGREYLDQTTAEVVADATGDADLPIQFLLRSPVALNSNIVLSEPCITGSIEGDFGGGWVTDRVTSYVFTVTEFR